MSDLVERVAKAIFEPLKDGFVGKLHGAPFDEGKTTLDGQYDLRQCASAAISIVLEEAARVAEDEHAASKEELEDDYWQGRQDAAAARDRRGGRLDGLRETTGPGLDDADGIGLFRQDHRQRGQPDNRQHDGNQGRHQLITHF